MTNSAYADAPTTIGYDGYLVHSTTRVPQNGTFPMTVRIYDSSDASVLYEESQSVTVDHGYFSLQIGSGTPSSGTFSALDFSQQYYIAVSVGAPLNTGFMTPHVPVNAAAYARTAIGLVAQGTAPASPHLGQLYFNTTTNQIYVYTDTDPTATVVLAWSPLSGSGAVSSAFGRTGAIVSAVGDYTASQITSTPAGTLTSTDVQAALNELDTKKQSTSLANTAILVGNASGVASAQTVSGDATLSNAGILTISANAITTAKILDNAITTAKILDANITTAKLVDLSVTLAKLAANAVDSSKIVDGSIATADLANLSVTTAKINALAVTASELASDAVTTVKILDANVTLAKLAANSVDSSKIVDGTVATADITDANVTTAKQCHDTETCQPRRRCDQACRQCGDNCQDPRC